MPDKIKILRSFDFVSPKSGKRYYVATAEIPNSFPDSWSTIRLSCLSETPYKFKPGDVIPLRLRSFDAQKGEGSFSV